MRKIDRPYESRYWSKVIAHLESCSDEALERVISWPAHRWRTGFDEDYQGNRCLVGITHPNRQQGDLDYFELTGVGMHFDIVAAALTDTPYDGDVPPELVKDIQDHARAILQHREIIMPDEDDES